MEHIIKREGRRRHFIRNETNVGVKISTHVP